MAGRLPSGQKGRAANLGQSPLRAPSVSRQRENRNSEVCTLRKIVAQLGSETIPYRMVFLQASLPVESPQDGKTDARQS